VGIALAHTVLKLKNSSRLDLYTLISSDMWSNDNLDELNTFGVVSY